MTIRIFVSRDAGAVAVGADEVALALEQAAVTRGLTVEIIRTGSRGLYWLEPLVEVATPQGRVAYGPVTEADAGAVLDAMAADAPHTLRLGITDEIPWLKRQTRLTFARCGVIDPRSVEDYRAHDGYKGSTARWRSRRTRSLPTSRHQGCAAAAAPASRPVSSGRPWRRPAPTGNSSSATPTKATAAPLPTE